MSLPQTEHTKLERDGPLLKLWLNRPELRNAMSKQMHEEILATFQSIRDDRSVRVVLIRGAGGSFCAGGDIKNMSASGAAPPPGARDELKESNRAFGRMMETVNTAPQAVICAVEGYAMGGGFGLACVGDVTIARDDALFAMSEVTLGIVPAAISPFVVKRIGLTAARRFGVSGARLNGKEAVEVGIAHLSVPDGPALEAAIVATANQILKCAPEAVAETKRLMHSAAGTASMSELLDYAAESFTNAVRGPEGREGTRAFVEKRKPSWVTTVG
ncbi:MAG TPA: enoyl-CoA hydratase-related protein [Candidatus Cybelea sp.]|nr:enoyl-CoA hydratase-related protein [Candidatus Cybelea sp.]